ncbi:deoxyuridine 5'-triphosphate nucleotidohydrolase [Cohnella silvisoli]|uniref:Deoxyuridine 5'-triphosphate nucleotidohydrolase n=1 Tax=Cohnella silvisoli TaxID=2873699 RepID=A0ABV1L080_9BACL|nr:deoxyuridine 5'-triphosphate nucleotidohydrolase [Cohnella silvisoli]MCD9024347.1 deoxyuridine 5'-triphosphate nucleotidohydrolase [Cohnella silvisoli]
MNINIQRLRPDATLPTGSATFDLYAAESGVIAPGLVAKIPLGLTFEIPPGHVMIVTARPDLAFITPLRQANGICVIGPDNSEEAALIFEHVDVPEEAEYGRELITLDGGVETWDIGLEYEVGSYLVRKGDRVASGFVIPVPAVTFTEVDAA